MDDEQYNELNEWRRIPPHVTAERMIHIPRFFTSLSQTAAIFIQMAACRDRAVKSGYHQTRKALCRTARQTTKRNNEFNELRLWRKSYLTIVSRSTDR